MTDRMSWDVLQSALISAQTSSSNAKIRAFVYLKDGTAMVPRTARTIPTNLQVVVLWIARIITSNVTTKSAFTRVLSAMEKTIAAMVPMSLRIMVVVHPNWLLVRQASGLVQA